MNELGYPLEQELKIIQTTVVGSHNFHAFMETVRKSWNWDKDYFICNGDTYELHTCGWSGNEEVIAALQKNVMFWLMYWKRTTTGGHYIFSADRKWQTPEDILAAKAQELEAIAKKLYNHLVLDYKSNIPNVLLSIRNDIREYESIISKWNKEKGMLK